jgi:1-acyl-sn-glycerol-3-phosphate acyltransferase
VGRTWSAGGLPGLRRLGARAATRVLDLFAVVPIALFVWWLSARANRIHFHERAALRRRIERALAEGRPVVVASNHVSWFDDPVIPMALFRSGRHAAIELVALCAWLALCAALPDSILPAPARLLAGLSGAALVVAFGARKAWWTLGDLVNLSDASVLRGKLELVRPGPAGRLRRALLALADPAIRSFMRSGTVKTLFVDRRSGEGAKRARARALEQTLDVALRPEAVWLFFEGGRSRDPEQIAPARHGVGSILLGLRARGAKPLLVALCHRGMERVIPPGAPRFVSFGQEVFVRWTELDLERPELSASDDPQRIADAVRGEVVRLQQALRDDEGGRREAPRADEVRRG